jgi:hypothetical protein
VASKPKPAHLADAAGDDRALRTQGLVAAWWRRLPRVVWRPGEVLTALRVTDEDDMAARQEPILAVVLLAGMTAVLLMGGTIVVDASVDGLVAAALTFVGGGLYGAAGYFVLGLGVWIGVRGANGVVAFVQARHLVATSAVPIALSFFVVAPVVAIAYGVDYFRGESGSTAVLALGLPFVAWAAGLLVAGLRVTYRLSWAGVATAVALGSVLVAAFVTLPVVL